MTDLFMVTTADGIRVADNKNKGFKEDAAQSDAKSRNAAAEGFGLTVQYKVVPFVLNDKEKEK